MITIKITNIEAVVEKNKGWFVANVVGAFVDLEPRLELILIAKLREALLAEGVQAEIEQVRMPALVPPSEVDPSRSPRR